MLFDLPQVLFSEIISYFHTMSTKEIIQSINNLPFKERIIILEKVLKSLHETKSNKLEKAAKALASNYLNDEELTIFTSIDLEKFYDAR